MKTAFRGNWYPLICGKCLWFNILLICLNPGLRLPLGGKVASVCITDFCYLPLVVRIGRGNKFSLQNENFENWETDLSLCLLFVSSSVYPISSQASICWEAYLCLSHSQLIFRLNIVLFAGSFRYPLFLKQGIKCFQCGYLSISTVCCTCKNWKMFWIH